MSFGTKKEFCLWMVGGKDGRVRKLRFTLRTLVCATGAVALVGGAFLFVASDYARVHLEKAESYFRLRRALEQNRQLEGTAQNLQSTVSNLTSAQRKALNYEQQIRSRLDELASLLDTSDPGRMLAPALGGPRIKNSKGALAANDPLRDPVAAGNAENLVAEQAAARNKVARSSPSAVKGSTAPNPDDEDGIGGAEVECGAAGAGAECLETARASLKPISFSGRQDSAFITASNEYSRDDVLEMLDRHIETLRVAPIGLPAPGYISSGFGFRVSPFHGGPSMHEGIDFSLPAGSTIHATGDGVVVSVERNSTYGLVVDIAHADRVVTRYAHMSKVLVSEGEKICRGEVIGLVGSTGRSTAPHLHYEVRIDGRATSPLPFMRLALDLKHFLLNSEHFA